MNQIVVATSEPMQLNQVMMVGPRRFVVLRQLNHEEYEQKRRENAATRAETGRRFEDYVSATTGDDATHLALATDDPHPADTPEACTHYYEVREV